MLFHVPRTGGTAARAWALREFHGHQVGDAHDGVQQHPGLPGTICATARNPWDWYRSWYTLAMLEPRAAEFMRELGADFRSALYAVTHGQCSSTHQAAVICDTDAEQFRMSGLGLCSWMHWSLLGDVDRWVAHALIATDRMDEGFTEALRRPCFIPRRNTSAERGRSPMSLVYDDEMLGWVAEADGDLAVMFGWTGPGTAAQLPLVWTQRPEAA